MSKTSNHIKINPLHAGILVVAILVAGILLGQYIDTNTQPSQAAVSDAINDPIVVNPGIIGTISCRDGSSRENILKELSSNGSYMAWVKEWQRLKALEADILAKIAALDPKSADYATKLASLNALLAKTRNETSVVLSKIKQIEQVSLQKHGCIVIINGSDKVPGWGNVKPL